MNIAVCDDEENIRCLIGKLIERQEGDFHIMEFSSGGALLQFWKQEEREEPVWGSLPLLIFVSGHSEYMPQAFSVNAFQYLMKPIDEREFEEVFAQALRECRYLEAKREAEPRRIPIRSGRKP